MNGYEHDHTTAEELQAEVELYSPFTAAVRDLVDASIRSLAGPEEIRAAQAEIEAVTARLRAEQLPGSYGVRLRDDGTARSWGNAVVGLRNPVAPPLRIQSDGEKVWSDFHLGAAYEGPPTMVHGGVTSLLLDQLLGHAASAAGRPGMTASLTLSYRRPTPLGDLRAEAWVDRSEGYKTWAKGVLIGPDGVTVEAEGLFILPRWAREQVAPEDIPASFE
ncbi:PaaI family thioesterase [Nocardioides sp. dk4132]|uniref:PaaI family thioesterase n=1 Tax=unclassified Nocardioides TaxID=2615069 RepID=UPI001297FBD3|nr:MULTISPECIES: PaaI family thioesterase [unclassified Nocardioides]MQW77926.1 PaaI family thioesterase [Nocardioides sp. dk4132]QGA09150.1 PaaI family thioesterase [Nocardioides sp. dk884]